MKRGRRGVSQGSQQVTHELGVAVEAGGDESGMGLLGLG